MNRRSLLKLLLALLGSACGTTIGGNSPAEAAVPRRSLLIRLRRRRRHRHRRRRRPRRKF